MEFTPLLDRVLVRPLPKPTTSPGGLALPETQPDELPKGVVVAVGRGVHYEGQLYRPGVRVGETIVLGKYSGEHITLDGVEHLVVREGDVLGILGPRAPATSPA